MDYEYDDLVTNTKERIGKDEDYYLNNNKLKKLGWLPETHINNGLQKTIDWYRRLK